MCVWFFVLFSICSKECPPGVNYFFDQTVNTTVKPNEWYYFITSHMMREKPLTISVRTNGSAKIYQSKNTECPTEDDVFLLDVVQGKVGRSKITIYSDIGITLIGIKGGSQVSNVLLKLENQSPPKKILTPVVKIVLILSVMVSMVIAFFFYVTSPKRISRKID